VPGVLSFTVYKQQE